MHILQFEFYSIANSLAQDSIVYAASVELFLRNIHTVQLDSTTLEFESDADLMYAVLLLSDRQLYTVKNLC